MPATTRSQHPTCRGEVRTVRGLHSSVRLLPRRLHGCYGRKGESEPACLVGVGRAHLALYVPLCYA